jgi:hypothetical protein
MPASLLFLSFYHRGCIRCYDAVGAVKVINLLIERSAKGGPWMAHWTGGIGCCWIDDDRDELIRRAVAEAGRYAEWRQGRQPDFSPPSGEARVVEEVQTAGGPVGTSGSPMALFARDRSQGAVPNVTEAFDVADHIWGDIERLIAPLSPSQRSTLPSPGKRTIEQTLEHLGNCFWWYCSRIDDELPEWPDAGLSQEERADAYLRSARAWCIERAATGDATASVKVPTRYPTDDPTERWTFAKVIRRQAEHLWEHRGVLERDVTSLQSSHR